MNQHLRERIVRKLDTLSDERAYQILDFVEFLESKYAERQNPNNIFTKFADTVEDGLRAGKISGSALAETMNLMNKAMGVLGGVAEKGKSVASDIGAMAKEAGKTVADIAKTASPRTGNGFSAPESSAPATPPAGASQADGTSAAPGHDAATRETKPPVSGGGS